ncbi:LysR family transcriptional regulator [Sphingomonas mollis]|uniref:LysR family transcriptional regulator n=1 Tax=Sphingomonas mollis TaxID=2795726 RepID=A0ABS0XLF1_9SPHN|nr:LysR family transcriptional regulator [Sphingomonas sp. BT553]
MIDSDYHVIFAKVGDLGSISGAARALKISKTNVSRAVTRLEQKYGVRLVERTTKCVSLTEIGTVFHRRCVRLATDLAGIDDEIASYRDEPSGTLRLGLPSHVSTYLAPYLPQFLTEFPAINLRMKVGDRLLPGADGFDVVLYVGWLADSTLVARKLRDVPLVLVASPSYLSNAPPLICPSDLGNHEVFGILPYDEAGRGDGSELPVRLPTLEVRGSGADFVLPQSTRFASNDQNAVIRMAEQGLGIVPTSLALIGEQIESGRLVRVLPDFALEPAPSLYAIYSSKALPPPKVKAFADFITRINSEIPVL